MLQRSSYEDYGLRRTRRHSMQTDFFVNSSLTAAAAASSSGKTDPNRKGGKKGKRPSDKAGWQQRWSSHETKRLFDILMEYNARHPDATVLEKQKHLEEHFPERSFHGIVNKYALEVNRARGRREDPYPELREARRKALSCHITRSLEDRTLAAAAAAVSKRSSKPAKKTACKYGGLLARLRTLVAEEQDSLASCAEQVMRVARDAAMLRDELTASLNLAAAR